MLGQVGRDLIGTFFHRYTRGTRVKVVPIHEGGVHNVSCFFNGNRVHVTYNIVPCQRRGVVVNCSGLRSTGHHAKRLVRGNIVVGLQRDRLLTIFFCVFVLGVGQYFLRGVIRGTHGDHFFLIYTIRFYGVRYDL